MNSMDYSLMFVTDDSVTNDDAFFKILEDSLEVEQLLFNSERKIATPILFINVPCNQKHFAIGIRFHS
jgi:hypothetical protein